jgi:protein gp37
VEGSVSGPSSIEWTDSTWNVVRGCARVSPGCEHCYAERQAHRFSGAGGPYEGLTVLGKHGPRWSGAARFVPEMLDAPLRWRKPRRIFVNSMSDLFHADITNEQIAAVFGVMAACPQHTFQILTKRPERMRDWFRWVEEWTPDPCGPPPAVACGIAATNYGADADFMGLTSAWPLPNVWLGVSCEDQQRAEERIPLLLDCPAVVRFVSAEPLLGPLNLRPWLGLECTHEDAYLETDTNAVICDACDEAALLDWVIAGGESGPGARVCDVGWLRSIVAQCKGAGTACFVKQLGATIHVPDNELLGDVESGWSPYARSCVSDDSLVRLTSKKGGDPTEWPLDLRVRQMPEERP